MITGSLTGTRTLAPEPTGGRWIGVVVAVVPTGEGNFSFVRQNDLTDWLSRNIRRDDALQL